MMFEAEIAALKATDMQNKAEFKHDIQRVEFRLEQAIKDQNDKINALLDYMGVTMGKVTPATTPYKVTTKVST